MRLPPTWRSQSHGYYPSNLQVRQLKVSSELRRLNSGKALSEHELTRPVFRILQDRVDAHITNRPVADNKYQMGWADLPLAMVGGIRHDAVFHILVRCSPALWKIAGQEATGDCDLPGLQIVLVFNRASSLGPTADTGDTLLLLLYVQQRCPRSRCDRLQLETGVEARVQLGTAHRQP